MKTVASKINQASFLLKTTEVTARLLLVLTVMMQRSGAPKVPPLPSCLQEAPSSLQRRRWVWDGTQPFSCPTCQGKMYSCPPCINSSCSVREMTSLLFPEKGKDTYTSRMLRVAGSTFVPGNTTEMQGGDHHTMPMLLRHYLRVSGAGLVKNHASSGRDLTRSQLCHRFVLSV